eukprot:1162453_1
MAFEQSNLYQTFLKIIDITISNETIDDLELNLSLILSILNPSKHSPTSKKWLHEFIEKGYFIQLLQHLFSSYSTITKQWNTDKRSTLIFELILSAHIPPHVIIDCLTTLWKAFVSPLIDTEQPSYSIQQGDYTATANDIIHLMKQLLSKQSHLMILLADWGTHILDNTSIHLHKYSIDPQCEQNIRCIVSIHDLFAPYFYLYRDYFRSLTNTDNHHCVLFDNYQFFKRKCFVKYLIQSSIDIIVQYALDKLDLKEWNDTMLRTNKHLYNLCKGIAIFWSILIRVGYVDMLNELMLCHVKNMIQTRGNCTVIVVYSVLMECIAKLPGFDKWLESFLVNISHDECHRISCVENIKFMIHLLHRILKNKAYHSQIEYLLSHKFIMNKRLPLHTLDYVISLLNYLNTDNDFLMDINEEDGDHSIMIETIHDIGKVWGTTTFALKNNYDTQQYMTRALVLLIQFIIQRLKVLNKLDEAATLIPFLFKGVQSRFSSDIEEIKHLGMIVAQQYSKVYPNTNSLNFGVDLSNVFKANNSQFQCCDVSDVVQIIQNNALDYKFKNILLYIEKPTVVEMKQSDDTELIKDDVEHKYTDNEHTVDASWLDEMRQRDMNSDNDANVWSSDSDEEEENKNTHDDLQPYSLLDDEEDLRKVPLPSYIRDCWNLLNAKQKPDETESGLIAATGLIRNNPSDLKHVAVGLCQTLLRLQNEYSINNFAIHKRTALVSLIVVCPGQILSYLPYQLYTKQWSVGVKLEILTVLVDAAREMGNLSELNKMFLDEDTQQSAGKGKKGKEDIQQSDLSIISQNQSNSEKERWKIIDARVAMKTKRWASKPKHVPLKENKFAKYATQFVYPILNGYHENEAFLLDFPALNTRILFALGCCVECSGAYGVDTVDISKDIFELILSVYYNHKLPEVRRTSVFVLSRILLHVPSYVLKEQLWFVSELNALVQNLMDMATNDTDYATRNVSKLCLKELKQIFE